MKYFFPAFLFLISIQIGFSQNSKSWNSYFSYNEIKDVSESSDRVFAASENALFSKSDITNEIKTTNTIDGLPGQTISALYHSEKFNRTLVGYENGLLIIINPDGSIKTVVDIINKQINPTIKKINHFHEHEGIVYVSCDFGVVQYNLATLQFGDTYFIGDNGAEIKVMQTVVFNGFIYAATAFSGIRRANILSENLIDYNEWINVNPGNWIGVEAIGIELVAVNTSSNIHRFNGSSFQPFIQLFQLPLDLRENEGSLVVTTQNQVHIYNPQLAQTLQINTNQITEVQAVFTCATVINGKVYIGTKENGLITTSLNNSFAFEFLSPNGPERNAIFGINASTENIWAVFGGYDASYDPHLYSGFEPNLFGVGKFTESKWFSIPKEDVLGAKSLSKITINPTNPNEVYISSYHSGLLKIENDIPNYLYDQTNSAPNGPETLTFVPNYTSVRINGAAFDKTGNLWITNSMVLNGLKVLKTNNQWQRFETDDFEDPEDLYYDQLVIDKNGTKWFTSNHGIMAFNETTNVFKRITEGDEGNLPSRLTRTIAIDNRNQLWIGTTKGLRVLSSVDRYNSDEQMTSNAIIIMEEGVAQELMYEQFITDIVVDGANNKWIGTAESGVFQVSSNGQQILQRFTITNSPLPSNSINDIDINPITGEVFFATTKGMVSFKGFSTTGNDNLQNVKVYPNPVRPEYYGTVKITGLLDKARIKITDIEGNLVHETVSEGGTIEWDTTAFGKYKVASGVYMIFISAQDGIETKVKKVMIIR
ncbi:ligand-binding sensor domain-containing protein [Flavobacterium arsenatis]|uniref:Ligand-binding sensor domain-containing protein n=1 Tax=Flavobacterium arsenatis TaxID=1484332 RepID=A0ABU1TS33_9FLAO|nr:T9SS type A sorting domain-containing protein [Flavobacterium arsenatis]MDR6968692.1 ligand-binding sensor domain-containing protein [Flavobacterium arsenatis]